MKCAEMKSTVHSALAMDSRKIAFIESTVLIMLLGLIFFVFIYVCDVCSWGYYKNNQPNKNTCQHCQSVGGIQLSLFQTAKTSTQGKRKEKKDRWKI